jgi:hypothetical protein
MGNRSLFHKTASSAVLGFPFSSNLSGYDINFMRGLLWQPYCGDARRELSGIRLSIH